jgi:phosphomannomutase
MEVIDVGMVTTPMLYFAASTLCTSGIQVTGSHNPKDYNGFKMVLAAAPSTATKSRRCAAHGEETWQLLPGRRRVRQVDVLPGLPRRIVGDVKLARPMKIVVDSATALPARRRRPSCARWAAR